MRAKKANGQIRRVMLRGVLALFPVLLIGCPSPASDSPPEPAPPLEAIRLDGSPMSLEDLRGRTVLLDFWATWCAPCVLEIPELNAVYAEQAGEGFDILAISLDDDPREELAAWVKEHDMQYPVVIGTLDAAQSFGAVQFPYHVLVSPKGEILERLTPGFHDREELEALVGRHTGS